MTLASLLVIYFTYAAARQRWMAVRWRCLGAALMLMLVTDVTLAVPARAEMTQDEVLRLTESGNILPFPKILDCARRHHDGKLLEAELEREHNRYIYEVDLLDHDGKIWELKFDAVTGEFLSKDKDK